MAFPEDPQAAVQVVEDRQMTRQATPLHGHRYARYSYQPIQAQVRNIPIPGINGNLMVGSSSASHEQTKTCG